MSPLVLAETDGIKVKMLHVFVEADVDTVLFKTLWVFENPDVQNHWNVELKIPAGSQLFNLDDPNSSEYSSRQNTITSVMQAGSRVGSVGFSFIAPNRAGTCGVILDCGYDIDKVDLYLSGSTTKLASGKLEYNDFVSARSDFSRVYSGRDLPVGEKLDITITGLVRKRADYSRGVCGIGFGLIVTAALTTLYYDRRNQNKNSDR